MWWKTLFRGCSPRIRLCRYQGSGRAWWCWSRERILGASGSTSLRRPPPSEVCWRQCRPGCPQQRAYRRTGSLQSYPSHLAQEVSDRDVTIIGAGSDQGVCVCDNYRRAMNWHLFICSVAIQWNHLRGEKRSLQIFTKVDLFARINHIWMGWDGILVGWGIEHIRC